MPNDKNRRAQDIDLEEFLEVLRYQMQDESLNIHDAAHLIGTLGTSGMSVLPTQYVLDLEERAKAAETKLAAIRTMATRSVPHMLNLEAIDRIIEEKPKQLRTDKKPRPMPTKEALAEALSKRYGGRPIEAAEIIDSRDFTEEGDADTTVHFQAWRNAMIDWYQVTINDAGQVDYTSIQQLPF